MCAKCNRCFNEIVDLPTVPISSGQSRFELSNPDVPIDFYFGEMSRYILGEISRYFWAWVKVFPVLYPAKKSPKTKKNPREEFLNEMPLPIIVLGLG